MTELAHDERVNALRRAWVHAEGLRLELHALGLEEELGEQVVELRDALQELVEELED